MHLVTKIDADRRLRIPEDWGDEFAPDQEVELVRHEDGVLIRPVRKTDLATVLKRKFKMNRPVYLDLSDLDMDELGW